MFLSRLATKYLGSKGLELRFLPQMFWTVQDSFQISKPSANLVSPSCCQDAKIITVIFHWVCFPDNDRVRTTIRVYDKRHNCRVEWIHQGDDCYYS